MLSQVEVNMRTVALLLLALTLWMGCSEATEVTQGDAGIGAADLAPTDHAPAQDVPAPIPWRFAVISDTHVTASETHPDNLLFAATGDHLSGLEPAIDLVVSTGDNIDDLYMFQDMFSPDEPVPVLGVYRDLIDAHYVLPFYVSLGNHDVRFFDTWMDATGPAEAWLDAFAGTESLPAPYFAVDHRGFQLLVLNGTGGATDYASNDAGTLEVEQLDWLAARLALGTPAILFLHHELTPGSPDDDSLPLFPVLAEHAETVRAVFSGHVHHFDHAIWRGIDFWTTGELKGHGGPVYHLVECDPETGMVTVMDAVDSP